MTAFQILGILVFCFVYVFSIVLFATACNSIELDVIPKLKRKISCLFAAWRGRRDVERQLKVQQRRLAARKREAKPWHGI